MGLAFFLVAFQIVLLPLMISFSLRGLRFLLEYLFPVCRGYDSCATAISNIAWLVNTGVISSHEVVDYLDGFSESDKQIAKTILQKTHYLTLLDVEFQDIKEQMLFCQALALMVSLSSNVINSDCEDVNVDS